MGEEGIASLDRRWLPSEKGNEHLSRSSSYEATADVSANGDPDEARYWRRLKVTPRNVRRVAIIKKRSAKFLWVERKSEA
jgi:hypothetical protein